MLRMLPICKEIEDGFYKLAAKFSEEHEWGITLNMFTMLVLFHYNGNDYAKLLVEDILEDCNFHTVNKMVHEGQYIDAINKFKKDFDFSEEE